MTLKGHLRKHLLLSYPVVIGQLGHIMVSVADTAMVGRVGVIPLAASTFAGTIYHAMMLFGIGVSYAITPLVAASDSKDDAKHHVYLQNAFAINLTLGLLMYGLMLIVEPYLGYFGQEHEVAEAAGPFLIAIGSSIIPLMIFQTFRQYSEGLSDTFSPMLVSILINLVNVALNYLLIFGAFGFPVMGLMGAAYATLIARVLMVFLMMWIIRKKWMGISWNFDLSIIRQMLKIGIPSGLQYVFEVGAFAVSTIMMGWLGAEAIAAHQIALNLSSISYMAATGIAAASTIRIGNQMGASDLPNLKRAGLTSIILVVAFMTITALVFIFFRSPLTSLYIKDVEVQLLASSIMIIAAAFQISDGLQAVGLGMLRGLTDVKIPTIVTFIAYWVIAIPVGYILAFIFEMNAIGIWIGLLVGLTIAAIMHLIRFHQKVSSLRL